MNAGIVSMTPDRKIVVVTVGGKHWVQVLTRGGDLERFLLDSEVAPYSLAAVVGVDYTWPVDLLFERAIAAFDEANSGRT